MADNMRRRNLTGMFVLCEALIIPLILCAVFEGVSAQESRAMTPTINESVSRPSEQSGEIPAIDELKVKVTGYLQLWWLVAEEAENEKTQPVTGDEAAEVASGFSMREARLAAEIEAKQLKGKLEIGLEGSPKLLDCYGVWEAVGKKLEVWAGQMKIPSTYEVETSSTELDFASRSRFSEEVCNWSLSRSPSMLSSFSGVKTYMRDAGVGLKGEIGGGKYFLMAGNGLGANLFIGAAENKQSVYTNPFGAYFVGARLSYNLTSLLTNDWEKSRIPLVEIGGHYCTNRHDNVLLGDTTTVIDINRRSWSVDLRITVMERVRLTAMMGEGLVLDDFDNDGKIDYRYGGWELKAVAIIISDRLEAGFRFDAYREEFSESGSVDESDSYTLGLTYTPSQHVRLQANYKWKTLSSETNPEIDDNVFLIALQLQF